MTERLYYSDSYLRRFRATVVSCDGAGRVSLDRTAFYPDSGGQPHDEGTLGGLKVVDVIDEDERIVHVVEGELAAGAQVDGVIDWTRRFDHMQQHSGQHLLSAVFEELFGYKTLSFHMGAEASTIDLSAESLEPGQVKAAEERVNGLVCENRPLAVSFEDAAGAQGLRKESGRSGLLRIVTIDGCDRSACGGTHVRATGEIGPVILRKVERVRGTARLEFVCGLRAVRRVRAEYAALSAVARLFSASPEETPALVAALQEQAKETDKARRKLALEAAGFRGKALYEECAADARGRRTYTERRAAGALDEEARAVALSFCAQPQAVYIAASANPPSVMLVVSADSGLHAGNVLKEALAQAGGRGGGSAQAAQGSLPSAEAVEAVLGRLAQR
jgi:alanyl-tRNA synthetase